MATNDWSDRFHDALTGKVFALNQGKKFFWYIMGLWIVTFIFMVIVTAHNWQSGLLAVALMVIGLTYSYTYKVLLLPEVAVAAAYGIVTLFPVAEGGGYNWYVTPVIFVLLLARENIKNIDHPHEDIGYKKTIASLFGSQAAAITARCMIAAAVVIGLLLASTAYGKTVVNQTQIVGMLTVALAGNWLLSNWFPVARMIFDLGALTFLLGGIFSKSITTKCAAGTVVSSEMGSQKYGLSFGFPEFQPERIIQPRWIWSVMIALLFVIVTSIRLITGAANINRVFISGNTSEALITGTIIILMFLLLFFSPHLIQAEDKAEESETVGYRIVKRMSSGLLLGIVGCVLGFSNIWLTIIVMAGIAIIAIMHHPKACWHMKQRGFQLGSIIALSLFGGINYALEIFIPAYAITVGFYYAYIGIKKTNAYV